MPASCSGLCSDCTPTSIRLFPPHSQVSTRTLTELREKAAHAQAAQAAAEKAAQAAAAEIESLKAALAKAGTDAKEGQERAEAVRGHGLCGGGNAAGGS